MSDKDFKRKIGELSIKVFEVNLKLKEFKEKIESARTGC